MIKKGYRKTAHATYDIKIHIVWITKYRKPVMSGRIAERARELIRGVCKNNEAEILAGHISKDHVHLLVSMPPHLSVSKLVQYLKGYSSRKLLMENKDLNKQFWGQHLWARGYFAASSGNVTDEVIIEYIKPRYRRTTESRQFYFGRILSCFQQRTKPTGFQPVVV